jgi:hypothetical protein
MISRWSGSGVAGVFTRAEAEAYVKQHEIKLSRIAK